MMALVFLHTDSCSVMVDSCSVMHHPSTPLLRNIICHVQKGGIIDQLRVKWHFESQKMSVGNPLLQGSKLQKVVMKQFICWGCQPQGL
jgi:hypothetical protein